jgi:hypothetical protein
MVATAGCARGAGGDDPAVASANGSTPAASASATAGADTDAPVKFSQCMREHGLSWFPDPKPDGRLTIDVPPGVPKEKVDAAQEACKQWAPGGGDAPKMDPADLEKVRQMAKCMRANGVPNFPDPQPDGRLQVDGNQVGGPDDPTFAKAQKICDKLMPSKPAGADGGPKTLEQS